MHSVMAGLVPAIHALLSYEREDVDARHKAGHDGALCCYAWLAADLPSAACAAARRAIGTRYGEHDT